MSSSSTNNRAVIAANGASRKRKSNTPRFYNQQVGSSSSKRVALELFPTHPKQNDQFNPVSQSPVINFQSSRSLVNSGGYTNYGDNVQSALEVEDHFEDLFKSQYEKMRESCKQYLNNKYNDILRQAEERASGIRKEKDMEMALLRSTISYLKNRLASDGARLEQQNEVIKTKNTELDTIRRKYIEQEEQVGHFKSQAEAWKEKAEKAEEMLWNATVSPRHHSPCCCEDEDTASSSVGETRGRR